MTNYNYMINTKCPHCGKAIVVAVSGFGGELSVREKECKYCRGVFFVQLLAATTTHKTVTDGSLSTLQDRIRHLSKTRKEMLASLLIKHELYSKLYQESLDLARQMREKNESN